MSQPIHDPGPAAADLPGRVRDLHEHPGHELPASTTGGRLASLLASTMANEDRRPDGSLGLVILDLDHFKKLNDTYGHPAGDAALRSLARLLTQHLRKGDQAAR